MVICENLLILPRINQYKIMHNHKKKRSIPFYTEEISIKSIFLNLFQKIIYLST